MNKKNTPFLDSKKASAVQNDNPKVKHKKERNFVISLSMFLQAIIVTIFCLFFLIIYFLVNAQNDAITVQSNLQLQGEVSEKIQNEIKTYLDAASAELSVLHSLVSKSSFFEKKFDDEVFFAFVDNVVAEHESIKSIYFGDVDGNFYMVKRTENNYISKRIIKNNGVKIISRWIHRTPNSELEAKLKPYEELSIDVGYDPRKRPWYQNSQESNILWTDPYFFATEGVLRISGSRKVSQGGVPGVLGIDLNISYLTTFLKRLSFSNLGHIIITDKEKRLIAFNDKNNTGFDKVYEEYFTSDNQKRRRLLSIDSLKSSEEMTFFVRDIVSLSESSLVDRSTRQQKNILDILLSTFFPKYSKSASLRGLLLRGLTTGNVFFNNKRYIYTYSPFAPFSNSSASSEDKKYWSVYTFTDTLNINASSEYITKIIIWIFAGFIILFIFIMYQSSKIISKPLIAISQLMLNFKQLILNTKFVNHSMIRVAEIENIGAIYNDVRSSFSSFKKFVPDVVVKQTLKSSSSLQASMSKKVVSVLFSDIEGFTSITERVKPEVLCDSLTLYFSEMSQQIGKNDGVIDKFIGDAIMAMFGAFDENNTGTAKQAVNAALAMHEREEIVNKKLQDMKSDIHFHTRIGINTGDAMVGIIGSEVRLNFTVIGDMVNLASRLESANKQYGSSIIISADTKKLAGEEFVFRFLDNVQVKGKEEFVMIYQLVGRVDTVPYMVQDYIREYEALQTLLVQEGRNAAKEKIASIEERFIDVKDSLFESLKHKILSE